MDLLSHLETAGKNYPVIKQNALSLQNQKYIPKTCKFPDNDHPGQKGSVETWKKYTREKKTEV